MTYIPTVGVVAICYNEEVDIINFLENVSNWAEEIVIVDSGSTDNTLKLINAFTSEKIRIIKTEFDIEEGYAGLRNLGLKNSTTDWVLNMDIDERTTPEFINEIKNNIVSEKYNAYKYQRTNYFLNRPMSGGGWNSWNNPQLAKRSFHHYVGKVHEKSIVDGGISKIGQLKSNIIHLNDDSYKERMRKSFIYCQKEAEILIKRNKKITYLSFPYHILREFLKKYFIKLGFLDGIPGLISAVHSSNAIFRTLSIAWDNQNKISRSKIESKIADNWKKNN